MTYRQKVIWVIVCYLILVLIYRLADQDWLYFPGLMVGIVFLAYLLSIRFPSCGRGQVIRVFFLGVGLPSKNCYYCKTPLEKNSKPNQEINENQWGQTRLI